MKRRAVPKCPPTPTSHGAEAGKRLSAYATPRSGRSGGLRPPAQGDWRMGVLWVVLAIAGVTYALLQWVILP